MVGLAVLGELIYTSSIVLEVGIEIDGIVGLSPLEGPVSDAVACVVRDAILPNGRKVATETVNIV